MKEITGHLAAKNNKCYAVVNLYVDGKRKPKWIDIDWPAKKVKSKEADHRLNEVLAKYNQKRPYLWDLMDEEEREVYRVKNMPILEYLEEWLCKYKNQIAHVTHLSYQSYIRGHISDYFNIHNVKVGDVRGRIINDFYGYLKEKGLSGNSRQKYHSLLHVAFNSLVKNEILMYNPIDQADRPKGEMHIIEYYNTEEMQQLIELSKDDDFHLFALLGCVYGLRRSEIIGLKWSAIDFSEGDKGKIAIKHTVIQKNSEIIKTDLTKTHSSYRSLPLLPNIREALLKEKAKQEDMKRLFGDGYYTSDSDYVFVDALGYMIKPSAASDRFDKLLKKIEMRRVTPHALRHSCATQMLSIYATMKDTQDWLGHSDYKTTANTYSHVDTSRRINTGKAIYDSLITKK